ncbi:MULTISPECIES: ABC transporter permease [unclassified Streptomyces]|uniref:ABC transporter permease n=1 Tax=unclassified Streptomyces TaxID=2593676 RepID=UPI003867551C|nr:FtsX-like permease family protein [Streptomyces sp. NBC_01017]WSV35240.1 FtsX-like permease family protein [Streptomyces sp. NBC_01017]
MRAMVRWVRADLREHRGEALFLLLATAGIVVSLLLAGALLSYAANPWQRVFTQSSGAHVWMKTKAGADPSVLGRLDGVQAVSGPFLTAPATAGLAGSTAAVQMRAVTDKPPRVARPLVTAGRWLAPGAEDEAVLESSLARALWAEPGDRVSVRVKGEAAHSLRITGVADIAESPYEPGEVPGVMWVSTATFRLMEPQKQHEQIIGLRLADPQDSGYVIQRAVTELGADRIADISTWQDARAEARGGDRLLGLLLGVFGVGALLAAALAGAGAAGTRIRSSLRDISVLKAIGFTPAQLIQMFLAEYLALAVLGIVAGALATELLGARLPGRAGEAVQLWQALPGHIWVPVGVVAGAIVLITATVASVAWRAGRVPPVPVARAAVPSSRRMSGTARRALGLRLPPALVLGWRSAFQFPLRACAAVGRLAVPLLLITIALGTWTTLDRFENDPQDVGIVAALTARGDGLDDASVRRLLSVDPAVAGVYPGVDVAALVPGQTGTITLRGLGTADAPYPFAVNEGRAPDGPDEAIAGQGLLDLLDVKVGDWVRMTVGGSPQVLHIVGRSIEPEDSGRVISASLRTLQESDPALRPDFYALVLEPGVAPSAVRDRLNEGAGGRLDIRESANPVGELSSVQPVIAGLVTVLALIGLAELSTTIAAGVRDRRRDLLALKAIGLTPRQIVAVIVAGTGFIALAAAVVGTGLGVLASQWLINLQGASSGIGSGIAQPPPLFALLLLVAAAVAGSVAVSIPPAVRAVRHRLADTLSDTL